MNNTLFNNLTPEMQLLLACCTLSMKQNEQDRKESLERLFQRDASQSAKRSREDAIDWSSFLNLVDRHSVDLLVYHNIHNYATEQTLNHASVPPDVRLTLKNRSDKRKVKTLTLTAELTHLSKLFAEHGIFMLSFKGPLLSQHLFGNLALRNAGDLDLLVKPEELEQAEQLLQKNGYQQLLPDFTLTPRQRKAYLKTNQHVSYYHPQSLKRIEIHWRLHANRYLLPETYLQQMMTRTQQLPLGGTQITTLSDEDMFLYLCLHGAHHGWSHLKWLCDIAQFLHREPAINWEAWIENVLKLGLHRPVAQALLLAHQLLDAPLPPATRLLMAENKIVDQLVAHAIRVLTRSSEELFAVGQLNAFRQMPYRMKLKADPYYKWSDFSRIWSSANDWKHYPLPDALFPLYYVLGPFSWLRRKLAKRKK